MSAAAAVVLATGFVLLAPTLATSLEFLQRGSFAAVAFVLAVVLWGVFALQDGVLTALRRATWVPVENALFGVVKLALLVAFASVWVEGGIFASWTIPVALAIVPVNVLIFRRLIPAHRTAHGDGVGFPRPRYLTLRRGRLHQRAVVAVLHGCAAADHRGAARRRGERDLLRRLRIRGRPRPRLSQPRDVADRRGRAAEERLNEYTRRVLKRSALILAPVVAAFLLAAPYLPRLLGEAYAADTPQVLQLLVLGSLPRMVTTVYMSAKRVERRVNKVVAAQAATSVVILGLSFLLAPDLGVEGVALAWACGHTVVALGLVPWLVRTVR